MQRRSDVCLYTLRLYLMNTNALTVSPRRERTLQFYAQVREDYEKMAKVEKNGAPYYHPQQILITIALKHFRSPKTIENIVFYRVKEG